MAGMRKAVAVLVAVLLAVAAAMLFTGRLASNAFEITGLAVGVGEKGKPSLMPAERIREEQIRAGEEGVLIRITNATIGKPEGTNSMRPLLDSTSSTIMIRPEKAEDIKEGDIIAYYSEEAAGLVVHRVVRVGKDENGWYALAKGDNSEIIDPEKIKFEQVKYVVVGIIY